MERLNTTPMTDEGKPLYLDESGERFIDIDGDSGAQGNPLYHTAESQSLDEYDHLQQAHNESEARNKAIDGMFSLDNLLTLKAEVERAQSIAHDESYLGGTQKRQEQVFDHSRGIKDTRVAHYVNVWVGKDAPADLRNALSAIVGAEIALSYQDLQDKAEAEAHSGAKSEQSEQKLSEYPGNLSPIAGTKDEAVLAPKEDDNTVGDGGAETGDEPESAGKRKRSRWPLGMSAVAGYFGRGFRNFFHGDHLNNDGTSAFATAGRHTQVVHPALATSETDTPAEAGVSADDVIDRVPKRPVAEMSDEELEHERGLARGQSKSAAATTKDGARTPVPVQVHGDVKRFRGGITDNLGIRPPAADARVERESDSVQDGTQLRTTMGPLGAGSFGIISRANTSSSGIMGSNAYNGPSLMAPGQRRERRPGTRTQKVAIETEPPVQDDAQQETTDDAAQVAFGGGPQLISRRPGSLRGYTARPATNGLHVGLDPSTVDVRTALEKRSGGRSQFRN